MVPVRRDFIRDAVIGLSIQHPFPVCVLLKNLDGYSGILVVDHLADFHIVDTAQQRALTADFTSREVELVHCAGQAISAVTGIKASFGDPGMFKAFINRDPFVDADCQHPVDEVKGWVTDTVPVRGRVVEAAHFDLLGKIVRVFRRVEFIGEGREAAETDVENHPQRPDVDCAGVFAVLAVLKDLGSDV